MFFQLMWLILQDNMDPHQAEGGWDDDRLVNPSGVDSDLRCPICSSLYRDAVHCRAQHAFCSTCIHVWLARRQTCPNDRNPLTANELVPARFIRQTVDKHVVRCEFAPHGCDKTSTIETIDAHERNCDYRPHDHVTQGCRTYDLQAAQESTASKDDDYVVEDWIDWI